MTVSRLKSATQPARLLAFLRANPGASSLEITIATDIVNTTGRISDLRAQGVNVVCITRADGRKGYRVIERRVDRGEMVGMGL